MQAQNPAVTAETDCTFDFSDTPQGKNYPIFIIQAEVYHKKCPRATGAFLLYAVQFCADARQFVIVCFMDIHPVQRILARGRLVQHADNIIRVLLPEPDSPTIATNSPGHTVKLKMCDGPCRISLSEIRQSPCPSPKNKKAPFPIGNEALMQNEQFFANSAKIFFTAPRGSRKGPDAPGAGFPSFCAG